MRAPICASFMQRALSGSSRPRARQACARTFLERIHDVLNALDEAPMTTIAAVHGITFGGGFRAGAGL